MPAELDKTTFKELMTDTDGIAAKEQYLAVANRLFLEGRRRERVIMALVDAAFDLAADGSVTDFGDFLRWFKQHSAGAYDQFCTRIDKLNEKIDREAH